MIDMRNFYIDGAWVAPLEGTDLPVFNPATEEPYATISLGGAADAEAAIAAARWTFPSWSMTTPAERGEVLGCADILGADQLFQNVLRERALLNLLVQPRSA